MSLTAMEVYEKHADELVRFATGLVGPDDAPDVVADVFVKMVASWGSRDVVDYRAYLYRAVLNEVRMRHRSTMRRRAREMRLAGPQETYDGEVRLDVLESLGELSSQQRAAVVLTYWEDLRPREVAERLGVSEGSIRRQLARARGKLREVLNA